jgi:crotonobetainyl-CoA:carnitine CoA-transferase CaiB-like acyl-CoA transferase
VVWLRAKLSLHFILHSLFRPPAGVVLLCANPDDKRILEYMKSALDGITVLEIAEGISGPYCGKLMAGLGANVTKVEPPDGDAARRVGPFRNDIPNVEASGLFLYLNTGKKSVTLDLSDANDAAIAIKMAADVDIVVENYPPGELESRGLGYADLVRINAGLVNVSITPFGQYGPYRDFAGTDMVIHALSGELYLAGRPGREPLKKGGNLSEYHGGLNGYLAALNAIISRATTGRGQNIDVSLIEGATAVIGMAAMRWVYMHSIAERRGAEGHPWPNGVWPVKDGYILAYNRPSVDWWSMFVRMMDKVGVPGFADPKYTTPGGRAENVEELDGMFQGWLSGQAKEEVYHLAQAEGLPFGYVATAPDLFASPQLRSREFFERIDHPEARDLPYPGAPFVMDGTPFVFERAPLLGEHNHEVLRL